MLGCAGCCSPDEAGKGPRAVIAYGFPGEFTSGGMLLESAVVLLPHAKPIIS